MEAVEPRDRRDDLLEDEQPPDGFNDSIEVQQQHEEQNEMVNPLRWLSEQKTALQSLSRVTESPIASEEEPVIRKNVELFNELQAILGKILDDGPAFLAMIDKMEQERTGILEQWKTLVNMLDNYYHLQLKKMLALHEKLYRHSMIALSDAEKCLKKSEKDELGLTDTIKLWKSLQAAEKDLCGVTETLEGVCKCKKPTSVSNPQQVTLESGVTTIMIKREEEEQGTYSVHSRLALKVDELQLQRITCDGMIGQLKTKSAALAESVREEEKVVQPLVEEMEAWLGHVQSLLATEPVRQFHGVDEQSLPTDEDDEFVEDPDILSDVNTVETDEEEAELDRELWRSPSPPLVSDEEEEELLNPSTLLVQEDDKEGSFDEDDEEEQNGEAEDMSKSVDITLGDKEYAEQVTEQIISPNTPVTEWEEERKKMKKVVGKAAKSLPVFSFDQDKEEEEIAMAKSIEEEEDQEEKDQEREDQKEEDQEEGEEDQEGEENQEGEQDEEEGNEERESNGEDESVVSYDRMGSEYSGSSSCRTDEDLDSLEWIKNITVFSFMHEDGDTTASDQLTEKQEPLSHAALIDQLQMTKSQLEPWSHKMSALASSPLMVAECDLTRELKLRLDHIVTLWGKLTNRIGLRIAQLQFELTQTTLRSWLWEVIAKLEFAPKFFPPPDEVAKVLEDFNSQFGSVSTDGDHLLKLVDDAGTELTACDPSVKEKLESVTTALFDALTAVCIKVTDRHDLMTDAKNKWEELDNQAAPLSEWMSAVESLVSREVYGSSVEELSHCLMLVEGYQKQVGVKYVLLGKVVETANSIYSHTHENTSARHRVDTIVKGLTERWKEVEQSLSRMEKVLRHTMIDWREYEELYVAGCDFVSYVREITGEEQLEGSMGDVQLLPKFIHLSDEIEEFKNKLGRFHKVQDILAENSKAGNTEELAEKAAELQSDWTSACKVAKSSLDVLMAEHKEWVRERVEEMETMVRQGTELLQLELSFIECYPMMTILENNPSALLGELTSLTNNQAQFTDLEEAIYQIQQDIASREASIAEAASPGAFISSDIVVEGVVSRWEELTTKENALRPVLLTYSAQLHLASSLHDLLTEATQLESFAGQKSDMQAKLAEAKLFSKAVMEDLKQLSYDLDTVYNDHFFLLSDHTISLPVSLPTKEEVARVNQLLTSHIPALVKRSADITHQYNQMIALWNEYESLVEGVRESVCEGEEQLNDLKQRASKGTVSKANPNELLAEAKELVAESKTCHASVEQFISVGRRIVANFETKQISCEFVQSELIAVQQQWEEYQSTLTSVHDQLQHEADELNQFLEDLYGFCEQLNDVYVEVVDECCMAVPPRASREIVARHRQKLEKFMSRYQSLETEYSRLMEAAQHWEEFIVPDQWLQDLRETSPGFGEETCDVFSIRRQMNSSRERLSSMMKMLQEKSHDLELREGNAAVLLDTANELLEWVEQEMEQDMLALRPPGELDKLKSNSASLTSLRQDFETRKNKLEQLKRLVEEAKGEVSPAILEKIEQKMAQLMTAWEKMEETVVKTTISTEEVLRLIEVFQEHCREFEQWLKDGEERIRVWGLVQADLDRLEEQEPILETLNDEILDHRSQPDDLSTEATNIIKLSEQGTSQSVEATCTDLQERFTTMEESCVESRELCEDARAAMQEYEKKRKAFTGFTDKTTEQYEQLKKKPKRPVGVIQEVLDEHVDFVDEIETQRDTFNDMHEYGQATVIRFLPSEKLQETVSSLLHLWEEFVGDMSTRWDRIVSIQLLWKQYESGVKEILGWISDEAGRFSKEVTTWGGEKGVADHMDTCKMLQQTLQDKKPKVDDLEKMAEELSPEDTPKPNGTSDVGSRLNDMHMHWNSICQLLTETLENLTRVYAKLCTINDITTSEIDWLIELQEMAAQRQVTRGNVELIQNEITRHKGYQTELEDHRPAAEIIEETLPFLLEHSKSCEHDAIKLRVQEFVDMFANMTEMEDEYVFKMEKSVPIWIKFNEHKEQLSHWLAGAEDAYNQRLQSGDADLTMRSLRNAEELGDDIAGHRGDVSLLDELTQQLALLCTSGDQSFLTEVNNQVTERVQTLSKDTEERRELLETRVKSWEVFPVEEAREVKNFVETLESSMTMELDENCSAEELLEQLKHLEELQEQQRVRGGKVAVIDQSADDEEIQKALEKNPDISKERSNLLQGWSRSSSLLSDKLVRLKLRAEMTQKLEACTGCCRDAQQCYSTLLNTPLPPSPLLADTHTDILEQEQSLRKTLENALHDLMQSYHRYNNDDQIQIPQRLQEQVLELETHTQELLVEGEQKLIDHIPVLLHSWSEFQNQLDELSRCVDMACSELDSLRVFPDFLMEFDALHSRHQMLRDSLQEYEPVQLSLTKETQRHLFGEDPSVVLVQERHKETDRQWCTVVEGARTLTDEIAPWQQLVDKEAELGVWCSGMKTRVETELAELGRVEGEDEDPTEFKTAFKLILEKLNDRETDIEQFDKMLIDMVTEQDRQMYPRSAGQFYEQSHSTLDCYWTIRKSIGEQLGVVDNKSQVWHTRAMKSMRAVPQLEAKLKQREKELARVKRSKQLRLVRFIIFLLICLVVGFFIGIILIYPEAQFRLGSFLRRHNIYTVTREPLTEY